MTTRNVLSKTSLLLVLLSLQSWAQPTIWKLGAVTLTPETETADGLKAGTLHVTGSDGTGLTVKLAADVHLTNITDSFISKEKVAVLGNGSVGSTVVVFDLASRREIDRFACYLPRRLLDDWIVFIEWYPNHSYSQQPTDVILAYDLAASPLANRLAKQAETASPTYAPWAPTRLGIPIYPEVNARKQSYDNFVLDVMQVERILGSPMILLSSRKLILSVTEGFSGNDYRTHLAIVDLSQGLLNPMSRRIDLPTDKYPRRHQSPLSMDIKAMEEVSPHEVKLYLPESEYGVSSIVVEINP